jgi:predicted transcriptional regulator
MKKIWLFVSVLAASISGFSASMIWTLSMMPLNMGQQDWMINMMSRMMGASSSTLPDAVSDLPSYFLIVPAAFLGAIAVGLAGTIFYAIYPEIRRMNQEKPTPQAPIVPRESGASLQSIMRTLKPDERLVVDILHRHSNSYLQKYISKEAGLSRLKTHRIVARLSERGMVTVKRKGNTNEVSLADWLHQDQNAR